MAAKIDIMAKGWAAGV